MKLHYSITFDDNSVFPLDKSDSVGKLKIRIL